MRKFLGTVGTLLGIAAIVTYTFFREPLVRQIAKFASRPAAAVVTEPAPGAKPTPIPTPPALDKIAVKSPAPTPAPATPDAEPVKPRIGWNKPLPHSKGAIRLAAYNCENLFDDKDDPELSGQFEDKDMAKPKAQLEALAATIRAIDPDVLALEETESKDVVLWFRDTFLPDMRYAHVASVPSGDPRGIDNALLSRFPITAVHSWAGEILEGVHPASIPEKDGKPIRFARTPLQCDLDISGVVDGAPHYALTVIVVHHKSGKDYGYQREAEAKRLLEHVHDLESKSPNANIAIVGDFNATPRDTSVTLYTAAGFFDVFADRAPRDPRFYTHQSNRTIDYILVNRNLKPELLPDSKFILGTPMKPSGANWDTTHAPAGYASDHAPVVVDLVPVEKP